MSLQLIAKEMEAKGRKGDSMLVHMTPGEVAGLQKLAESAGGTLTVNPDTGLVEANFLKQMLPTLVGLGVGIGTGNPMLGSMAGAAVGGYQARRSNQDVGLGMVMGGLGGYGGATMGAGFNAAGASTLPVTAGVGGATAAPVAGVPQAMRQAAALEGLQVSGADAAMANARVLPLSSMVPTTAPTVVPPTPVAPTGFFGNVQSGFAGMGTEAGRAAALKSMGGSEGVMRMLMMAGLPYMNQAPTYDKRPGPYPLLSADVNKRSFADGGEVGFFTGGGTGQSNGFLSSMIANRPFIIDPVTGNVIPNPNIQRPAPRTFADMGIADGRSGEIGYTPNADFVTPAQQRAYYAENPMMANVTGIAQNVFGMTPLGIAQNAIAPEFVAAQKAMVEQAAAPVTDRVGMDFESSAGMGGATEGSAGSTAATANSPDGPDGANASAAGTNSDGSAGPGDSDGRSSGGGDGVDGRASGGLLGLAKGGMRSGGFVVPADVVSMVGEGNTDAGYKRIKSMVPSATAIKGKDGGQSDTVKTNIEGKQRARVAHGEMYIPPEAVKRLGGAKKLYAMMDRVRQQATGSKKQIKPVSLKRAMA